MPRTPRPELMALLADVKQNPDDLTPWLVLCDWLEDRDDEAERARGEYCRLCFDKLGQKTYASDWEKGERRRHLYRMYHEAWLGPIAPFRPQVQKGLLTVQCHELGTHHVEALKADPEAWAWVGTLQMGLLRKRMMSNSSALGWLVSGLHTFDAEIRNREVPTLASWDSLRQLRVLKIRLPSLNLYRSQCLIESPTLNGIRKLEIQCWQREEASTSDWEIVDAENKLKEAFGDRLALTGSFSDGLYEGGEPGQRPDSPPSYNTEESRDR